MSRHEITLSGNITDAAIEWFEVTGNEGVVVSAVLLSGSATITPKRLVAGTARPFKDSEAADYSFTASFDQPLGLREGDIFGVGVSGASSPTGTILLTGRFTPYDA